MSRRPGWRIDDVLARTDLAALLDELAQPATYATRGRRWHCPVPDHDDHHASVTIHTDHRGHERWRCWSGDQDHRGDAIDLVRVTQRLGRLDAVDWLGAKAGMIPDQPLPPVSVKPPTRQVREHVPLDPCVVRYAEACGKILWGTTGRPVREWLNGRGFDDELLRANRVGCDPGRAMMHRKRGLPYGGSIGAVFPCFNEHGDIHYVQTRYLNPGAGPKYDNPSASLGTNPRFSWNRPAQRANVDWPIAVCEGIPDGLTAAALGLRSASILGSGQPTAACLSAIAKAACENGPGVVVVAHGDDAGRRLADSLLAGLERHRVLVAGCWEPNGHGSDLNDHLALSRLNPPGNGGEWRRTLPGWEPPDSLLSMLEP